MIAIQKIGFTCGAFDLFHAGHNIFLSRCKDYCDKLIVGLHTNPNIERNWKHKPIQTSFERCTQLNSCKFVDQIIPYDTEQDLINILSTLKINIRFIGEDYLNKKDEITGSDICEERKIQTMFIERFHNYSSTELIGRIKRSI